MSEACSLFSLLSQTLRFYRQEGWRLTRSLFVPLGKIFLGLYGWLILFHWFVNGMMLQFLLQEGDLWMAIVAMLLLTVGTLYFFFAGFWEYMVAWAAQPIVVRAILAGESPDVSAATRIIVKERHRVYSILLTVYMLLPLLACVPALLAPLISVLVLAGNPLGSSALLLLGFGVTLCLLCVWLLLMWACSFIFQSVGLDTPCPSVWNVFRSSVRRVLWRPWVTLCLQLLLWAFTNLLAPLACVQLPRWLGLMAPFDALHVWILSMMMQGLPPASESSGVSPELLALLTSHPSDLAAIWTDMAAGLLVTALLLPLGSIAFTQLYLAITPSDDERLA